MIVYRLVAPHSAERSKSYRLTSPTGDEYPVMGLKAFAILFGLPVASLKNAARGSGKLNGWQIDLIEDQDISEIVTFWYHSELAQRMKEAKAAGKFGRPTS